MVKVHEIAFTGYPVTDRQKAKAFYGDVLPLKETMDLDLETGFWLEYNIGAGTLALSNMWNAAAHAGPSIALEVEDFASAVETLKAKGVPFDVEPFERSVCPIAVIADPDANLITIHTRKPDHPANS